MGCLDPEGWCLALKHLLKTLSQAAMFVRQESLLTGQSYYALVLESQFQEPAFPEADKLYYKISSHHLNCCHCLCLDSDLCWHSELFKSESSKLSVFLLNMLGSQLCFTNLSFLLQRNMCHSRGDCIKTCVQIRTYVVGLIAAKCYVQGHCVELNFICSCANKLLFLKLTVKCDYGIPG